MMAAEWAIREAAEGNKATDFAAQAHMDNIAQEARGGRMKAAREQRDLLARKQACADESRQAILALERVGDELSRLLLTP